MGRDVVIVSKSAFAVSQNGPQGSYGFLSLKMSIHVSFDGCGQQILLDELVWEGFRLLPFHLLTLVYHATVPHDS